MANDDDDCQQQQKGVNVAVNDDEGGCATGGVPVIDLGPLMFPSSSSDNTTTTNDDDTQQEQRNIIIKQIVHACTKYGFFQIINHSISIELINEFRVQLQIYFEQLSVQYKRIHYKRNENNSRGFFDDELTKQKLDWKQCLDIGISGTRTWDNNTHILDNSISNQCLDGFNQFPKEGIIMDNENNDNNNDTIVDLTNFRKVITKYFDECAKLSHLLTVLMTQGIDPNYDYHNDNDDSNNNIVQELLNHHTSYLRMNYYPKCDVSIHIDDINNKTQDDDDNKNDNNITPLGISPHKDAGFVTILLQDDDCHSLQVWYNNQWMTVHPIPGALTINTGDMAQIWSNGKYVAPLHRVLTNRDSVRYSAPFFYNPPYTSYIQPTDAACIDCEKKYYPVLWGYFRAVRFAGDLTNLGVEIQIDDYEIINNNNDNDRSSTTTNHNDRKQKHLEKQKQFASIVNYNEPFSVEKFRDLLTS